MQIGNEIMYFQIKQSVTSHERIDIQVRHSVMANKCGYEGVFKITFVHYSFRALYRLQYHYFLKF